MSYASIYVLVTTLILVFYYETIYTMVTSLSYSICMNHHEGQELELTN